MVLGCPIKGTKMSDSDTGTITPVNTSQFSHSRVSPARHSSQTSELSSQTGWGLGAQIRPTGGFGCLELCLYGIRELESATSWSSIGISSLECSIAPLWSWWVWLAACWTKTSDIESSSVPVWSAGSGKTPVIFWHRCHTVMAQLLNDNSLIPTFFHFAQTNTWTGWHNIFLPPRPRPPAPSLISRGGREGGGTINGSVGYPVCTHQAQ